MILNPLQYGCFCKLGSFFEVSISEEPFYLGSIFGPLIFGNSQISMSIACFCREAIKQTSDRTPVNELEPSSIQVSGL